ncbi:MAG: rhomboid family intramembrane serine protease [Lachnospiraceae bacterium]|nr:rhomboid family intramembrane serine protease [Lachnospiraceae bacterium]
MRKNEITEKISVTVVLIVCNVLLFLLTEMTGGSEDTQVLIRWGGAYTVLLKEGQYWRLLTAMFLHSGMRHLTNNMLLLGVIGTPLERQTGKLRFLLIYFGGGIFGGLMQYRMQLAESRNAVSIGASGAVCAAAGAMVWVVIAHRGRVEQISLQKMLVMIAFMIYFGFTTEHVANAAHIGGLISGFLICMVFYRSGKSRRRREWERQIRA